MTAIHLRTMILASALPCLAVLPWTSWAMTILVPEHEPTIQAGIDAATPGDTVQIACGIYYEHDISIATSGICIMSENQSPECVTIDAQGAGRVFHLAGIDTTTSLEGLTITGGSASDGGGMYCDSASPTLYDCCIIGNSCSSYGGGIYGSDYSSISLFRCTIVGNSALGGGGVYCRTSSPHFIGCQFLENIAAQLTGGGGGGLYCSYYCAPQIEGCQFIGNHAASIGGAFYCAYTCNPTIHNVQFLENTCDGSGGAAYIGDSRCSLFLCRFEHNIAAGRGGGLYIDGAGSLPVSLSECTYWANQAAEGGGLSIRSTCRNVSIDQCTFSENSGGPGGGISCTSNSLVTLTNTIIAFSPSGEALYVDGPDVATLTCSDLYGNAWGDWNPNIAAQYGINGNISEDPLFCDVQNPLLPYLLDGASPCAEENNPECGQIGAWPIGCGVVQASPDRPLNEKNRFLCAISPNPFMAQTTITYKIPSDFGMQFMNLAIYDEGGRLIRQFPSPGTNIGLHQITWNGQNDNGARISGGMFFCRLAGTGICETQPILLIR